MHALFSFQNGPYWDHGVQLETLGSGRLAIFKSSHPLRAMSLLAHIDHFKRWSAPRKQMNAKWVWHVPHWDLGWTSWRGRPAPLKVWQSDRWQLGKPLTALWVLFQFDFWQINQVKNRSHNLPPSWRERQSLPLLRDHKSLRINQDEELEFVSSLQTIWLVFAIFPSWQTTYLLCFWCFFLWKRLKLGMGCLSIDFWKEIQL